MSDPLSHLTPAVVMVRPARQGNIGGAARAMANMGLDEMILVEPAAPFGDEARAFAFGAGHVLDRARRVASVAEALAPFQQTIGTTSARNRLLDQIVAEPRSLAQHLRPGARTALLFGPEASGLREDELAHCGIIVSIPCSPVQPTLNLSQAVLVLAYELHMARRTVEVGAPVEQRDCELARGEEIDGLLEHATKVMHDVRFERNDSFDGIVTDLRQLVMRAALSAREVRILRGICRRILYAVGTYRRGQQGLQPPDIDEESLDAG